MLEGAIVPDLVSCVSRCPSILRIPALSEWESPGRRDEVAGCSERAYPSLKVEDAQRLLLMQNSQDTCRYAAEV